jgi:benzoylformate decarboxylase
LARAASSPCTAWAPAPAWPAFEEISVHGLARALGCPAVRIEHYDELLAILDEVVPTLADRNTPLVVEVAVSP